MIGLIMFGVALAMLLLGFPVAFTFGGVAVFFGLLAEGTQIFALMPHRIWSIMNNTILMAIPLFIFMGIVLQKSQLAERLLESMGFLFGEIRGGIAISTVLVGALLAASTGVVGASVVAMGVISLPVMLKYNYDKRLATGAICAAGTLGQIIPPSIVLIILGDVFQEPVGDLFKAALWPGLSLVAFYVVYIVIITMIKKDLAPPIRLEDIDRQQEATGRPCPQGDRPAAGPDRPGARLNPDRGGDANRIVLGGRHRRDCPGDPLSAVLVPHGLGQLLETIKISAMVFAILIGATAFSMVFTYTGGDWIVEQFMMGLPGEKWGFIILSMLLIMVLGFFIDFVEISYIVVPILAPIAANLGINPVWYAILVAMNLQTSFLTPPFGFSLFYLKGVAPPEVRTMDIYYGVVPFICLQTLVLGILVVFPEWFGFAAH